MKSAPYSIHVDEDVAHFLDRHKKVAGRPDSRGRYVSRAIRALQEAGADRLIGSYAGIESLH